MIIDHFSYERGKQVLILTWVEYPDCLEIDSLGRGGSLARPD